MAGDTPSTRRAPWLVRATAWSSFALGQMALPWLLVPVACAALMWLQVKLAVGRPTSLGITALLGVLALVQAVSALRLLPLGVRLLARDARVVAGAAARGRRSAILQIVVLAAALGLGWAMQTMPFLVHPVLRATLVWTLVRPIVVFGGLGLLHALLLTQSARSLTP